MAPEYEKLAIAFSGEKDIVIAKVDASAEEDLRDRFQIEGFPTLKFFGRSVDGTTKPDPVPFNGRELKPMVDMLNELTGTSRLADGSLNDDAGRVKELDLIVIEEVGKDAAVKGNENLLNRLKSASSNYSGRQSESANIYTSIASKIIANGPEYVLNEIKRLNQMIASESVSAVKKTNFMIRRNILLVFAK